jgi:MFS transporter, DHA2 family, methylenomycin A resistance protein
MPSAQEIPARAQNQFRTLVVTSISYVVVVLDASVVNVALNSIAVNLSTGIAGLQWIVNAYTLAFASLLLTGGLLGDRQGARRIYCAGLLIFTLASLLCGLAPSTGILIGARALQGIGASLLVPSSLTLLNHGFQEAGERAAAIGIWAGSGGAALAAGPLVGGLLVETLGWRSIFLINLPIGLAGLWIAAHIDETAKTASRSFDVLGQALAIVALASLVGFLIEAPSFGWLSLPILSVIAVFVGSAIAFLLVERRTHEPMLPLGFFRNGVFTLSAMIAMVITLTFFGAVFVLSLYFQSVRHYSPMMTGLAFLPATAVVTLCNVLSGRLVKRFGPRLPILSGLWTGGAGYLGLTLVGADTPYVLLSVPLLAIGVGGGLATPAVTNALVGAVERHQSGVASGVLNTARQVGVAAGVALFGAFIANRDIVVGMKAAFAISMVLWIVPVFFTLRIYPLPRGGSPEIILAGRDEQQP